MLGTRGLGQCDPTTDPNCGEISTDPTQWGWNVGGTSSTDTSSTNLTYCQMVPSACAASGTPGSTSGTNVGFWATLAAQIAKAGIGVTSTRYGVPQLNPGQYIQSGPGGTVMYQQPTSSAGSFSLPTSLSSSMGGMLPIILIGGVLLMVMMSKK